MSDHWQHEVTTPPPVYVNVSAEESEVFSLPRIFGPAGVAEFREVLGEDPAWTSLGADTFQHVLDDGTQVRFVVRENDGVRVYSTSSALVTEEDREAARERVERTVAEARPRVRKLVHECKARVMESLLGKQALREDPHAQIVRTEEEGRTTVEYRFHVEYEQQRVAS